MGKNKNVAEEEIVYIAGIRYEQGHNNMLMSKKLSINKETNELVPIGPGSGLPLKKNERISENAFVEIVKYVELSTDKDLLNKLAIIAKKKQKKERRKKDILYFKSEELNAANREYEEALRILEEKRKIAIDIINNQYDSLMNQVNYDIETLNIFNDSILSRYEELQKVNVKK